LDPSGNWQDLYLVLDNRDNRGPGKELEEASASDGQFAPSWIWLSNSNTATGDPAQNSISPDEVNEDMRVEWAQCVARADRWEEEVTLLQEEIRRVVHFLEWKSKEWVSRANVRAGAVTPEVSLGLSAYARKQASIFRNLAVRFCQRWRSTLVSLSLPHDWATKFLEAQGVPLIDKDSKKRKSGYQRRDPLKSPVAPRVESPATNTAATPPLPTGPENINDDDKSSSSDDSGTNSSEHDESEYESSSSYE
jgi:hypothetical protein